MSILSFYWKSFTTCEWFKKIPRIAVINSEGASTMSDLYNGKFENEKLRWNNGNPNTELISMYYSIGQGGSNVGNFTTYGYYWSSTGCGGGTTYYIMFVAGGAPPELCTSPCCNNFRVRAIRSIQITEDDIDGDGIINLEDNDIDGDGVLNIDDSDMDGDGIINSEDEDTSIYINDCSNQITPNDTDDIINLEDLFFI